MEAELLSYRQQIDQIPALSESEFREALARFRAGDETGRRAVSGGCLRVALQAAEEMADPPAGVTLFDRIEEANAGLQEAVRSFRGSSLTEFVDHARAVIAARLDSLRGAAA